MAILIFECSRRGIRELASLVWIYARGKGSEKININNLLSERIKAAGLRKWVEGY